MATATGTGRSAPISYTWRNPVQYTVAAVKWVIGKVIEVATAVFNWFMGNPDRAVSEDYIWQLVSQEGPRNRGFVSLASPPIRAAMREVEPSSDASGGLAIADRRAPSPLSDLAALSVDEIGEREELPPHLAHLFRFCVQTASSLSRIIYDEMVRPSERSIQVSFMEFGRWFERVMNEFLPSFSPVNVLFAQLLELKSVGGEGVPESQLSLIRRIQDAGSQEELVRMFAQQQPRPERAEIEAYQGVVELFFRMIAEPGGEVGGVFWGGEVSDSLRKRVLTDVLMQFVASPVATFLAQMNHQFGHRLPNILLRCFNDNGLLIARTLFNRLRHLLEHEELDFTDLFDDVIRLVNQQAETLGSVEGRHQVLFEEARMWKGVDVSRWQGENLIERWRQALQNEIVKGIVELPLTRQRGEQLLVFETAIVAFNESPLRPALEASLSAEMGQRIDAKLAAIRAKLPAASEAREKLEEKARHLPKPRCMLQLLIYQKLGEEGMEALPEASGESLPDLVDAFIAEVISTMQRRENPLARGRRDFGELAKRLIALFLPEQREEEGGEMVDGVTALLHKMILPDEFRELFRFALKRLPEQIFGAFWDESKQETFTAWLESAGGQLVGDGLRWMLIEVKVRPLVKKLLNDGLSNLFTQLVSQEGLADMMALNILPMVNNLLLLQLALLNVASNITDAANLFQAGRSAEELTRALEVWVYERWDINAVFPEFQRLLEAEEEITAPRFLALLTLHFNTPFAEAVEAPEVYGDLIGNVLSLGRLGNTVERGVFPIIRDTVQKGMVRGLEEYRTTPVAVVRDAMVGLSQTLNEESLALLFQESPDRILAEQRALREELDRMAEATPRVAEITSRLEILENYLRLFRARAQEHAPERVEEEFGRQVKVAASLGYELIYGLAGAYTPWYVGGSFFGKIAATQLASASHLEKVIHTVFTRLTKHPRVNQDLLFRVFHRAIVALQALPVVV